jgi:hypothetical protein
VLYGLYIKSGGLKMKKLWVAVFAWVALAGAAQAAVDRNVTMSFESGGKFSGVITFADDFSSFSGVNGTLTGGTNGYSSPMNWVLDVDSWSTGPSNYSGFLTDGSEGKATNFILFAYNYSDVTQLSFTVAATTYGTDNYVNCDDKFTGGTIAAVPEPETYAMLLAGLGLMGAIAKRRKIKQA